MSPELSAGFSGLMLAALGSATGLITAYGIIWIARLRQSARHRETALELEHQLQQKRLELAQVELDHKLQDARRRAAADAAAIAQETSLGRAQPLTGPEKAQLAADKLRELEPSLAGADRSVVTDLVKIGASQLRSQSHSSLPAVSLSGAYLVTPSQAPPPDVVRMPVEAPEPPTLPPPSRGAKLPARRREEP